MRTKANIKMSNFIVMAGSLGIAGDEPGDEEVDSTPLVASGMGSSSNDDANQDSGE